MDPLSISASVVSLTAFGLQLGKNLSAVISDLKSAPEDLVALSKELEILCVVLKQLEGLSCPTCGNEEDGGKRQTPVPLSNSILVQVMHACMATLREIDDLIRGFGTTGLKMRFTWVVKSRKAKALKLQLEGYKVSLMIAMQAHNLGLLQTSRNEVAKAVGQVLRLNLVDDSASTSNQTDASQGISFTTSKETSMLERGQKRPREESINPVSKKIDFNTDRNIVDSHPNFDSWLSSFLPSPVFDKDRESSMGSIAEGEKHCQQRTGDFSDPPWTGDIISWKQWLSSQHPSVITTEAVHDPSIGSIHSALKSGEVVIIVSDLHKPGLPESCVENVVVPMTAQIYDVIKILLGRGYSDICGFELPVKTCKVGPIIHRNTAASVLITSGPSCYDLERGLRINENQSFLEFYNRCKLRSDVEDRFVPFGRDEDNNVTNRVTIRDKYWNYGVNIQFLRTIRIPDDGRTYNLPSGVHPFPLFDVKQFAESLPEIMVRKGGYFIPMYQREALYLAFNYEEWSHRFYPHDGFAVRLFAGGINAHTMSPYRAKAILGTAIQDYVIIPHQERLDGFCKAGGEIRQFVAMALGSGYTVESQLTAEENIGGFQLEIAPPFLTSVAFTTDHKGSEALDFHKTPVGLNLPSGERVLMTENPNANRLLLPAGPQLLVDAEVRAPPGKPELYPREDEKYRPTFVHELFAGDGIPTANTQAPLKVSAIRPIFFKVVENYDWHQGSREIATIASPFLTLEAFGAFLNEQHSITESREEKRQWYLNNDQSAISSGYYGYTRPASDTNADVSSWDEIDRGKCAAMPLYRVGIHNHSTVLIKEPLAHLSYMCLEEQHWGMGLAEGGKVKQHIIEDETKHWDWGCSKIITFQILNTVIFEAVTGLAAPVTPITFGQYLDRGIPFMSIPGMQTPPPVTEVCGHTKSVRQLDDETVKLGVSVSQSGQTVACVCCERNLCDTILGGCGHSFCGSCIQSHMLRSPNEAVCVYCNVITPIKNTIRFAASMETGKAAGIPSAEVMGKGASTIQAPHYLGDTLAERAAGLIFQEPGQDIQAALIKSIERGNCGTPVFDILIAQLIAGMKLDGKMLGPVFKRAIECDHGWSIKTLLQLGVDLEFINGSFLTVCRLGNIEMVRLLLDWGADPNSANDEGNGLMHCQVVFPSRNTCIVGKFKVLLPLTRILLDTGCDPNAVDKDGKSPIFIANTVEVVQLLLESGARVDLVDKAGKSVLDYQGSKPEVAEILRSHGAVALKGQGPNADD